MNRRRVLDHPLSEVIAIFLASFALTFVAFGPGLDARFVSDDVNAIVENEWVAGDFHPLGIVSNFSWWGQGRAGTTGYRPATTLSLAVNRLATGNDPRGMRVVNYAANALCAALLFLLARGLGLGREASSAAALIFTILPIHSEAVIWIVGRAELGAAAGFLLAALACLSYRQSGRLPWLAVAAVSIALGMAFKENAVTVLAAPAIFFLALGRESQSTPSATSTAAWRRDATAFAALAAGAAVYACLRSAASGPALGEPISVLDNPLAVVDTGTRLLGAVATLGRYLSLTLWPSSLSIDYSYDALAIGPGFRANLDSLVAVAFVAAVVWVLRRGDGRRAIAATGLLLAAASYSIVSNTVFVLGTILGERLFYLPSAGLCLAVAALAQPVLVYDPRHRQRAALVAASLVLLAGAALAVDRHRAAQWRTPVSLFEAAAAAQPRSARVHMELASAYSSDGRVDDAARHFATALAIKPDYSAAAYNQGNMLAHAGRYEEAAAAYRRALEIDPRFTRAWHNLALTERLRGRTDAWLEAMRSAAQSSPDSSSLRGELGDALLAVGRYAEAIPVYDALIADDQAVAATWFNRGVAHHHLGGCAEAVEDYRHAMAAAPAPREAFAAAAGCLRELGRNEEAAAVEQAAKVANRDTRR